MNLRTAQTFQESPAPAAGVTVRMAQESDIRSAVGMMPRKVNGRAVRPWLLRDMVDAMVKLGQLAVAENASGEAVGICMLARETSTTPIEIGWAVAAKRQRQGFGTAMVGAVIERLLEEGHAIRCTIEPDNVASIRIAERLGFTPAEGRLPGTLGFSVDRAALDDAAGPVPGL